MSKMRRIFELFFGSPKEETKTEKKSLPKIFWVVEMPDGQRLGGIHNKKTATWNVNRLLERGGKRVEFREDPPIFVGDPGPELQFSKSEEGEPND